MGTDLLLGALGIAAGGVLKGAIGAGAPVLGVPVLALVFGDVALAVALFAIPNLVSNSWQAWTWRSAASDRRFVRRFAAAGAAGCAAGSFLLVALPGETLLAALAAVVFAYVGLRLARPGWVLARATARRVVTPVGFVAGVMQGAGGISAPVSITFLSAMRPERGEFIATIAAFFLAMAAVQVPMLVALGVLTPARAALSLAALAPLFGGIAVGARLARHISRETFDRLILAVLALIALRLALDAL